MLPGAEDQPTGFGEGLIDAAVAIDVAAQLGRPVLDVAGRGGAVLGTRVPKTAVDEDGEPDAGKDDVRSHRQLG